MPVPGIGNVTQDHGKSDFPFIHAATRTARSGKVLDKSAILDARIYAPGRGEQAYLAEICTGAESGRVCLKISDASGPLAEGEVENSTVSLFDKYGRDVGVLVVDEDRLPPLSDLADPYRFRAAATMFASRVVINIPTNNVQGLRDSEDGLVYGASALIGENGVVLTRDADSSRIRVNVVGEAFASRLVCENETGTPLADRVPLQSIQVEVENPAGSPPDPDPVVLVPRADSGDVRITGWWGNPAGGATPTGDERNTNTSPLRFTMVGRNRIQVSMATTR